MGTAAPACSRHRRRRGRGLMAASGLAYAAAVAATAAVTVMVLAQAPSAAAQQHEGGMTPLAGGSGQQHGYVRRRAAQQQQEAEATVGSWQSGVRGMGGGRIRGLQQGGGPLGDVYFAFLQQLGLQGKAPGPLCLTPDRTSLYTVTGESLLAFRVAQDGTGRLEQIQELRDGVVDRYGTTVGYFSGLTAVTSSPDADTVYAVGTSVMPGVGGITVLSRDKSSGELSVAQQFRIDQYAGIADIDGMIGANSVAVSPDGKFVYVSSGGYYRDHHLLVFSRKVDGADKGRLALLQNIDVYNTSASRVLPATVTVAPDGKNVYVVGANFAISTSAILVYSVDPTTGQLTQAQEAGPFRGTLLTSAGFDPQGKYLYVAASFGNYLVWAFTREEGGMLTTVVDPELPGARPVGGAIEESSYASVLPLDANGLAPLLLVAVEKANAVYAAQRVVGAGGRLAFYPTAAEAGEGEGGFLRRPVSMAFDHESKVLFVAEAGDEAISSFRLTQR